MRQTEPEPSERRPVLPFMAAVLGLGAVFYAIEPLLGDLSPLTRAELPASALMFVCPTVAAVLLIWRFDGRAGPRRWFGGILRRSTAVPAGWQVTAILLLPLVLTVSYLILRWTGSPLPEPHLPLAGVAVLVVVYLLSGFVEELGWTGYATDPLRRRWGVLGAGLVIGVVWAGWHLVPYWQAGHGMAWIAWQALFTVAFRVVLVHLYDGTGSVLTVAICHASYNVAWSMFPNAGSHYDPMTVALLTVGTAAALTVVRGRMSRTHPLRAEHPAVGVRQGGVPDGVRSGRARRAAGPGRASPGRARPGGTP